MKSIFDRLGWKVRREFESWVVDPVDGPTHRRHYGTRAEIPIEVEGHPGAKVSYVEDIYISGEGFSVLIRRGREHPTNFPATKALGDLVSAILDYEQGDLTVTKDQNGQIVAVTKTDSEGRILATLDESAPQPDREALLGVAIWKMLHGQIACSDDLPSDERPVSVEARKAFGAAYYFMQRRDEQAKKVPEPAPAPQAVDACCGDYENCQKACYPRGVHVARTRPDSEGPPVDMILHCPNCGQQHVDAPEGIDPYNVWVPDQEPQQWDNPPHRSHKCHDCGHIWRPADIPTNGVEMIKTKGVNDDPPSHGAAEAVEILDGCKSYLKPGESPRERIEREMKDTEAALTLLARERRKNNLNDGE